VRRLLKVTTTFALALVFTAGVTFAQPTNDADVNQSGDDNLARLDQVFSGGQGTNEAVIDQSGNENAVLSFGQRGSGNELVIDQSGHRNLVDTPAEQGEPGNNSFNGIMEITQSGDDNEVFDADQEGYANTTKITQSGDDNFVNVEAQLNTDAPLGVGQTRNFIRITQETAHNEVGTNGQIGVMQKDQNNRLEIIQTGLNRNVIGSKSIASAADFDFDDFNFRGETGGPAKDKGVVQVGDGQNTADLTQSGYKNEVEFVLQDSREGTTDGIMTNTIESDQLGSEGTARFIQDGVGNTADLSQFGFFNNASIFQTGNGNTASVIQSGGSGSIDEPS